MSCTTTVNTSIPGTYSLTIAQTSGSTTTGTASLLINKKALTMSGLSVPSSKVYDGTTEAVVTGGPGVLQAAETAGSGTTGDGKPYIGDDVSLTGTATGTYDSKNVADASTVTFGGVSLTGSQADNYALTIQDNASATITPLHITGEFTADNKTYDRTNDATVLTESLVGAVSGDDVSLTGGTAAFDDKFHGTDKTVRLTEANLSGEDANNYVLDSVASTTADITTLHITGTFTADNKTYDGNTEAVVLTRDLVGAVSEDDVSLAGGTAAFEDKSQGAGKTVTLSDACLDGKDQDNYELDSVDTTTADITPLDITGTFTAENKTYDGNTDAVVLTRDLVGAISGDDVSLAGGTAAFEQKSQGTEKTVTLTDATLEGKDADNYVLDSVDTTTADVTPLHITGTFTASDKTYDGKTSATVLTRSMVGAIKDDLISMTGGTAAFGDKSQGTSKTVTLTGATLDGKDANNYVLDSVATTTANITPLHITGAFTASNKNYDGKTNATVLTRSLVGAIKDDLVSLIGGTATFDSANVGTGKTVTLRGASLDGKDANNYVLNSVATTKGSILANNTTTTITNAAALAKATLIGTPYPVTFTVTSPGGTPTGIVTVSDGTQSCTGTVLSGKCNLTSTTAGIKTVTAKYTGDGGFKGSTSVGVHHTVNQYPGGFKKTSPVNLATEQPNNPTLKWAASSNATSYEYCLGKVSCTAASTWTSTGTATSRALSGLTPGAKYYWQVRARIGSLLTYANGSLSAGWSFTVTKKPGAFIKTSPANTVTNQLTSPILKWGTAMTASRYEYCYDTTNNNLCNGSWTSSGAATSKTLSGLKPNTIYYWQVRAVNSYGSTYANGGTWWSFKTRP